MSYEMHESVCNELHAVRATTVHQILIYDVMGYPK